MTSLVIFCDNCTIPSFVDETLERNLPFAKVLVCPNCESGVTLSDEVKEDVRRKQCLGSDYKRK